jgi:hypothetical protein
MTAEFVAHIALIAGRADEIARAIRDLVISSPI